MIVGKVNIYATSAKTVYIMPLPEGLKGGELEVEFLDPVWDDLTKLYVFTNHEETKTKIPGNGKVEIPQRVLVENTHLRMGVCGVDGKGNIRIPTIWADLNTVYPSVDPDADPDLNPDLPIWAQILAMIGDLTKLETEDKSSLVNAINELYFKITGINIPPDEIYIGSQEPPPNGTKQKFDPDGEFFRILGDTAEDPKVLLTQAAISSLIGIAGGSKLDSLIIKSDGIQEITSADDLHKYCYDRRKDTTRVIQLEVSGGKNQNIIDALGGYPEGVTASDPEFVYLSWPFTEAGGFTLNAVLLLRNSFGIWAQTQYATYSTASPAWHKSGWIKLGMPVYASEKGKANGVATLGADGKVPAGQLPPYPSKTSDLTNDSGFITADDVPAVPDWAMQPKKPSYTASEVGALPDTTIIPSKNSELENDENYEKALTVKVDEKLPGVTSLETLRTFFYERRKATQRKAQFEISKGGVNAYLMDILGYPTGATAEDKAFLYIEIPYSEAGGFEIRYRYQLRGREGIWKMVDYATLNSGWKTEGWNPIEPFNDSTVDNQYGWHSKKIIDTLCLPFEEKGAVVTCHPVEDYPLHVVSEIAVKQEGDGDPSPENVRPIVMQDKVLLTQETGAETKTYTAQLPEPVAGGRVDWSSTAYATYKVVTLNEKLPWIRQNVAGGRIRWRLKMFLPDSVKPETVENTVPGNICEIYKQISAGETYRAENNGFAIDPAGDIYVYDGAFATAELNAWIANVKAHPIKIAYKILASKKITATVSGTPTALPGVNNLYSSTGDTTVTGRQDPIYTAENLISRVTALENNAVKEI